MADSQGVVGVHSALDLSLGHSAGPLLKIYLWPSPPTCPENGKGPTGGCHFTEIGCTLFACAKADEGASCCDQWPSQPQHLPFLWFGRETAGAP